MEIKLVEMDDQKDKDNHHLLTPLFLFLLPVVTLVICIILPYMIFSGRWNQPVLIYGYTLFSILLFVCTAILSTIAFYSSAKKQDWDYNFSRYGLRIALITAIGAVLVASLVIVLAFWGCPRF